jgi:hypothetical protein
MAFCEADEPRCAGRKNVQRLLLVDDTRHHATSPFTAWWSARSTHLASKCNRALDVNRLSVLAPAPQPIFGGPSRMSGKCQKRSNLRHRKRRAGDCSKD